MMSPHQSIRLHFRISITDLCIMLFWIHREDRTIYPLLAALLISGTVCFAVRMMPRYLYAAAGLTIFVFMLKWTKKRFICMISMNLCLFLINACDYLLYLITIYYDIHTGAYYPPINLPLYAHMLCDCYSNHIK